MAASADASRINTTSDTEEEPVQTTPVWLRRTMGLSVALIGAVAAVAVAHKFTLHAPVQPFNSVGGSTEYTLTSIDAASVTQFDYNCDTSPCYCGGHGMRCNSDGGLCCISSTGHGLCAKSDHQCCHGKTSVITCTKDQNCCQNSHGSAYCCAGNLQCTDNACSAKGECFPGPALVQTPGRGLLNIESLQLGDVVLTGEDKHETVLGFVHTIPHVSPTARVELLPIEAAK